MRRNQATPRKSLGLIGPVRAAILGRRQSTNVDPYWSSVKLLCVQNNGADGTTTFIDQSSAALSLTANGNAQWDNAQAPTGLSTTLGLDGTGDQVSGSLGAHVMGSGDFTLEFHVRLTSLYDFITWFSTTRGAGGFNVGTDSTGTVVWYSGGARQIDSGAATITTDTWYHIAFTRSGTSLKAFLDGTQVGSTATVSTNFSTADFSIGSLDGTGEYTTGHMAAVRYTKGVARYTGAFTPAALPYPTA